jgi:hypothetical protein
MKLYWLFASILLFAFCSASNGDDQRIIYSNENKAKNALHVKSIIAQHDKPNRVEAHTKKFKGETLAYVTPWNNRGKAKE